MVINRPLTVTTPLLLNLIQRRGGEPHNTLSSTPVWYDETAQRTVDQQVNTVLQHHGLMGPRGMDRDFAAMVESIARPTFEFYGWFEGTFPEAPENFSLFAGSGPGGGFVLSRYIKEDVVVLRPERPERLLPTFVDQIPRVQPGGSAPLVAPKSEVYGGARRPAPEDMTIMQGGGGRAVAEPGKEIRRILEAPRVAGGSLYAAARTRAGTRRRCERPLNFIDTPEGRWLMEERPGTGESLIVLTPGTPQAIGERLHNAMRSLG